MTSQIPAVYTDKHGTITTTIINDSSWLTMELNGLSFTGTTFVDFEPETPPPLPDRFTLNQHGQLINYKLSCRIPLSTWKGGIQIPGYLLADVVYYEDMNNPYSQLYFQFSFELENDIIGIGKLEQFEGVFEILKGKLSDNIALKACYTCLYSDYSAAGSDVFGSMLCFRNAKETYLKVTNKCEYMDMMDNCDRCVQETYLCEEFTPRTKDVGYRG